jgi:hypothetical protein
MLVAHLIGFIGRYWRSDPKELHTLRIRRFYFPVNKLPV